MKRAIQTLVKKGEIIIRRGFAEHRLEHLTQLDAKRLLSLLSLLDCNKTEEQWRIRKPFAGVGHNILLLIGYPETTGNGIDEEVKKKRVL